MPPTTTAELPERRDGELGWYKTAPEITLTADDGALGEVDKVEYRVDATATTRATTYDGAVHGRRRRASTSSSTSPTDKAENVEATKRLAFRVDSAAPAPEATIDGDPDTGPVQGHARHPRRRRGLRHGADASTASTAARGQVYAAVDDEVLFDGSEASLRAVEAGARRAASTCMTDRTPGGYITPVGGLGMLWYPVKQYGDFRLKFQFREGRTDGGFSNGGVFVRFPNPEQTPRVARVLEGRLGRDVSRPGWPSTAATRSSSTTARPARPARRARSTRSTTTRSTQAGIDPAKHGEWEDYEIEVVGQHYTIRRNGEVINEFDNTPGKNSDRARRSRARRCGSSREGYIGLQNHGGADTMQYRNMRVEDLTPGAPKAADGTGPFEVAGRRPAHDRGPHVDAAGNEAQRDVRRSRSATPSRRRAATTARRTTVADAPPVRDAAADDRHPGLVPPRHDHVEHHARDVRPSRPVGAGGLHGRDGRLGEADGLERDAQAAEAQEQRRWTARTSAAGARTRRRVSFKPSSAIAQALARKGGPKSVKMTVSVQMRDWGKPATTLNKSVTLKRR